ncbi:APC family permease [Cesiribacter andamanensis]|uniref:Low-affinity putrescine importer PlaP n=1 Tax=Cesiribacter andamanensis AMV16 TaxID=1279009 RepID=M7MYG2_9BACT|nr:APC family permease [Cesiribacter andamanensis]EMR01488.1 Low-affinity putrescine importer PlaP [Cesiribacter andamanensis AMV16]
MKQPDAPLKGVLKRDLGLLDAVGVGLGAVIGAGLFVVTGVAAGVAGPAFLLGLFMAGLAASCNGLSSAQLAATYPQAGGTYEYGYRVLNPWLGFSAGWMFLASKLSAGGVVALGFGTYLAALVPGIPPRGAAVAATLLLMAANYWGIKKAGKLNLLIVGLTLAALLYFILAGIPSFTPANLRPFAPQGWQGIARAAALLFFAFTGYARIATLGEEVRDPRTTIPRAVIITLLSSVLLYAAVALVAVAGVGADALSRSSSPLSEAARAFSLPGVLLVVGIGATTAMLGVLLSQLLGISRMLYAMARRRDLPALLERVHPRHQVPHIGIFLSGGIIMLLSLFGSLEFIISAASFTILLYYSITNLAALRMQRQHKLYPNWIPLLGLLFCLALAASLSLKTIGAGLALLAAGLLLRLLLRPLMQAR